jgi:hypothetical protein
LPNSLQNNIIDGKIRALMKITWPIPFCVGAVLFVSLSSAVPLSSASVPDQKAAEAKVLKILKQIYDEVKELGRYPGEEFIKREFFIGNEDDDDTYKNQHVVVLIQNLDGRENIRIQVTYMEPSKEAPQVKYAREVKSILGQVVASKASIQSSDYNERELGKVLPEILSAIQSKKKLIDNFSGKERSH